MAQTEGEKALVGMLEKLNAEADALTARAEEIAASGQRTDSRIAVFTRLARANLQIVRTVAAALTADNVRERMTALADEIAVPWMEREFWVSSVAAKKRTEAQRTSNKKNAQAPRAKELREAVRAKYEELCAKGRADHNMAATIAKSAKRSSTRVRQLLKQMGLKKIKAERSGR